jgi:tetratricopeptide (TPR) repeat protein
MSKFRSSILLSLAVLIFPTASLAQTGLTDTQGPIAPRYFVSVQQLKMSTKARKAFDAGAKLLQKGNAAESLAYFNVTLSENPQDYMAYYNVGLAHYRLGDIAESEKAFQRSIDLTGGGYAPPQIGMGMVFCEQGDLQRAEAMLERGLELEPGSAMGKYFLGWAQFGLNRLVEAERSVQQSILRKWNFAAAYFLLARIHQRQYNSSAVVQDLQAYLKLDPHGIGSEQARALLQSTRDMMNLRVDWTLVGTLVP